jgi:hypothetical protein
LAWSIWLWYLGLVSLGLVRLGETILTIFSAKKSGQKLEGEARSRRKIVSGHGQRLHCGDRRSYRLFDQLRCSTPSYR